jgi:SLT domain-containing protein
LENIANAINNIATAITNLSAAYKKIKPILDKLPSNLIRNKVWDFLTTPQGKAAGGSVMKNQAYRVGEFGSEIFVPSGSGSIRKDPGGGGGNTFIFNGVIDAQSARQSIERLLQTQSRISGTINLSGAMS